MKTIYELRNNRRVPSVHEKSAAPHEVTQEEQIAPLQCVHCGADLPEDTAFQELHYQKEHGART